MCHPTHVKDGGAHSCALFEWPEIKSGVKFAVMVGKIYNWLGMTCPLISLWSEVINKMWKSSFLSQVLMLIW